MFRVRVGCLAAVGFALYHTARRLRDQVTEEDDFSKYTNKQHRKHLFSGMHEPYLPSAEKREFVAKHFPIHNHLLPAELNTLQQQRAFRTSVKLAPLSSCPVKMDTKKPQTVVVGGAPALVSSIKEKNITYIHNLYKPPASYGSALHLEWDAQSEAPITTKVTVFIARQVMRAVLGYESLADAQKTGHFPWDSLNWLGWMTHPKQWGEGIRVALAFQKLTKSFDNAKVREEVVAETAARCKANQKFYEELNEQMYEELISKEKGSIIVARTPYEVKLLFEMSAALKKEDRKMHILTPSQMEKKYGFAPPEGLAFGEKTHDRSLSSRFMHLLARKVYENGGRIIRNGIVTTVYFDRAEDGGIVEYVNKHGEYRYLPFSKLVLSLGDQRIFGKDGKPLFDIVAVRGVSALALAYMPKGHQLPPAIVCGGTNHVTKIGDPVTIQEKDGQLYDMHLVRMTTSACITPNVTKANTANYDAVAATGLLSAVKKTLNCKVDVISVIGCNRQISEHGQSHWIQPEPTTSSKRPFLAPRGRNLDLGTHRPDKDRGIFIQMGAGGGGLTQAPAQPPLKKQDL